MNKNIRITIIVAIVLVIAFIIIYPRLNLFSTDDEAKKKEDKAVQQTAPSTAIKARIIQYETLEDKINTTGTILANEEVSIRSEISGKVSGIYFSEGDFVNQGTVLLTIYNEDLKAQLRKLELDQQLIETKENRQKQLLEKEAISKQEYDVAVSELNSISAQIELKKIEIAKTAIQSPFSGILGLRNVSVGSYLTSAVEITKLTNVNPAKIQFSIPAKYKEAAGKGSKIRFTVDGSEEVYTGIVYAVEPKIDEATRTIQIRATCPNPTQRLIPGDFAKIEVVLSEMNNSLLLPSEAIVPELDKFRVFVVKQGKAQSVEVEIGKRTDKDVQILKGLQKNDTVITSGVLKVKQDSPVTIQSYE